MHSSAELATPVSVRPKLKGSSHKSRSTKGRLSKLKPKKEPKEKDLVQIGKEHTTTILIYVFLT